MVVIVTVLVRCDSCMVSIILLQLIPRLIVTVLFGCGPLVLTSQVLSVNLSTNLFELGFHGRRINVLGLIVSVLTIPSQNIRIYTFAQLCHVILFRFRFVST